MLLDTASLYFRAFFGVPDSVTAPDGTPVNAVRGLLDFIATARRATTSRRDLVACWDDDWRPQFRVDAIPSYKAHRVRRAGDRATSRRRRTRSTPQVPVIVDGARRARHRAGRRARATRRTTSSARWRRRRHAGRSTSSPATATCSSSSTTPAAVRVLYTARGRRRPRGGGPRRAVAREVRRPGRRSTPTSPCCAATRSDGLPGRGGHRREDGGQLCSTQYGDLAGVSRRRARRPATRLRDRRSGASSTAAADYLDVAPDGRRGRRATSRCRDVDAATRPPGDEGAVALADAGDLGLGAAPSVAARPGLAKAATRLRSAIRPSLRRRR